tara:strand:+ start:56470 stop:56886 length:417 start_codon:yes stop_codon:yes gene_type:complete
MVLKHLKVGYVNSSEKIPSLCLTFLFNMKNKKNIDLAEIERDIRLKTKMHIETAEFYGDETDRLLICLNETSLDDDEEENERIQKLLIAVQRKLLAESKEGKKIEKASENFQKQKAIIFSRIGQKLIKQKQCRNKKHT